MRDPDVYLSQTSLLIAGMIYFLICFLIAYYAGRKRKVGLWWSFLFSVCFTPVVGLIITLASSAK